MYDIGRPHIYINIFIVMKIKVAADNCGEHNLPKEIYEACLKKQAFLFVRDMAGCVLRPIFDGGASGVLIRLPGPKG